MGSKGSMNLDEDGRELRRGPWTLDEDNLLIQYIASHGEGQWNSLAKSAGLQRNGKSCRFRWLNYLKPDTKRGAFAPHEQLLILELHSRWGNRWSKIAQHLPGRTDNEIKNYWRTRVQKQARQLKVDSNSKKFLEAIRLYWMPRLLEKMKQNTSSTSETPSLTAPPPLQIDHPVLPSPCQKPKMAVTDSDSQETSEFVTELSGKDFYEKSFVDECYNVDMQQLGSGGTSMSNSHVSDVDGFEQEIENSFWNSDELWQFRKID